MALPLLMSGPTVTQMDSTKNPSTYFGTLLGSSSSRRALRTGFAFASALAGLMAVPAAAWATTSAQAGGSVGCPKDMALVGKTCVDKFEGSLVEVMADGREVPFSAHQAPVGKKVRAVSAAGVTPQAHISMNDAQKACKASGKRLCHAAEWKSACMGPEKTKYPYGNKHVDNACVDTKRTSPIQTVKGGRYDHTSMNDPILNQLPNTVEPTGATSTCTNGYGVHDMVGNVHEWADDGAFHGGYYLDTKLNGPGCDYKTTAHAPAYYDYSTGFRCCADEGSLPVEPEPQEQKSNADTVAVNEPAPVPNAAAMALAPSPADGPFVQGMPVADAVDRESQYPT